MPKRPEFASATIGPAHAIRLLSGMEGHELESVLRKADPAELADLAKRYARREAAALTSRYSPLNQANLISIQQRDRVTAHLFQWAGLTTLRGLEILDVGCGGGQYFLTLMNWGAFPGNLHGIEALPQRAAVARTVHPEIKITEGNAAALPWGDERFDIVCQSTTFSSILDSDVRLRAAREVDRVLRPHGMVLWHDFWINPRSVDTRAIRRREIDTLFPSYRVKLHRIRLAPPLARWLVPHSMMLALLLQEVPLLQSHLLGLLVKPANESLG